MTAPGNRLMLRVPEVARVLDLGRDSTYAAIERGEVPSIRVGRSIRVPAPLLAAQLGATIDDVLAAARPDDAAPSRAKNDEAADPARSAALTSIPTPENGSPDHGSPADPQNHRAAS